ncbi:tetratricopeptide repeat protein [Paenibacillus taihuensis]|uniref:Tetratricopeptide repeat protein n=1 Tax=Paenibacillus taihuensis TaxID=1156355 RepID=A0A3D9Q155_9BACL|nr:glycosyltransferase family 2 protein [Paenibacillus taihuensis]REE56312.1 tetratricopeptide repeat protein [Paenibacillus taihuensis]
MNQATDKKQSASNAIRQALTVRKFKLAEKLALDSLRSQPLIAQNWVFLGEALLHQGYAQEAGRAFERGSLLDPQAQWTGEVEKVLAGKPPGESRADLEELWQLQPAVTVAAAIMTRNEARCIVRCVNSLQDAVDEIVIIDSDSTDGTIELVEHLPKVKIIRGVALNDDFAWKRNQALPHIKSDWVLWVDADEWLFQEDREAVRIAASMFHNRFQHAVLNVCQVNQVQGKVTADYANPRMFPLNRGLHYYGRVHEQVVIEGEDMYDNRMMRRPVRIRLHHDGYEPAIMGQQNKLDRNLRLLRLMVEQDPDNPGWYLYYGRETLATGDMEKAKELFLEAERLAAGKPNFGRLLDVLMYLNKIYMSSNNYEQAQRVCLRALEVQPGFPDAKYHLARAQMRQAGVLLQQAERSLKESKEAFRNYRGTVTADAAIADWKADLALADLTAIAGKRSEARGQYERILSRHPELNMVQKKLNSMKGE